MQRSFASVTLFVGGASSQETKLLHTWECYRAVFSVKFDSKCHYPVLRVCDSWFTTLCLHSEVQCSGLPSYWRRSLRWHTYECSHHTSTATLTLTMTFHKDQLSCANHKCAVWTFDYTWESSKTLHKVPSMLAACKSRTNKCSNFARCRQSGREHVDMFSNSIRCMDCMDHILGTQKRCSIVHACAIRHKGFISLGLLATVHAWARDIECRRSF